LFKPGIATVNYTNHAKEIPFAYFAWFAVKIVWKKYNLFVTAVLPQ